MKTTAVTKSSSPKRTFTVPYTAPFSWARALAFYGRRAVAAVEFVDEVSYARSVILNGQPHLIRFSNDALGSALLVEVEGDMRESMADLSMHIRGCFDLDADINVINLHLQQDPRMAKIIAAQSDVRVLAHWSPFETAIRTVLGQQITLTGAAQLNARLVQRAGKIFEGHGGTVSRLYPEPEDVLSADLSDMGTPGARIRTLLGVAEAFMRQPQLFERSASLEETEKRLMAIKGVGSWTAHYIAMRACREPDAFPAGDAGLLRGAANEDGKRPTAAELELSSVMWRPWRAYAAHHLWANAPEKLPVPRLIGRSKVEG
jgi:AraC family transcriptional regulator of adaptative response / DNA-3-methyladenine glycosylase II